MAWQQCWLFVSSPWWWKFNLKPLVVKLKVAYRPSSVVCDSAPPSPPALPLAAFCLLCFYFLSVCTPHICFLSSQTFHHHRVPPTLRLTLLCHLVIARQKRVSPPPPPHPPAPSTVWSALPWFFVPPASTGSPHEPGLQDGSQFISTELLTRVAHEADKKKSLTARI